MNWGISSYALTWSLGVPGYPSPAEPLTIFGMADLAARHGIRLLQIADNVPLHELSDSQLEAFAAHARKLGIRLEVGTRGTEPARLRQYLDIARRFGSSLVRTLITEPNLAHATPDVSAMLPEYEQAGVCLAVENHGLHTAVQLKEWFDSLPHACLGCCLDTVNSFGALEAPDTVIRTLAPYTVNVHLKDFDIKRVDHQMGFTITGTPAGYGKLDIGALFTALRPYNRNPSAVLELWTPFVNTVDETLRLERNWLEQSIAYLAAMDLER